jgi:hypothetical protein
VFGTFGITDGWRGWTAGELRFLTARAESWQRAVNKRA